MNFYKVAIVLTKIESAKSEAFFKGHIKVIPPMNQVNRSINLP